MSADNEPIPRIEHLNSSEFAQATTMDNPSSDSSEVNLQVKI